MIVAESFELRPSRGQICEHSGEAYNGRFVSEYSFQPYRANCSVVAQFEIQTLSDGNTVSLCYGCGEPVAKSEDLGEIELAESTHECQSSLNSN